jgi:enoyl-CoA hydratase/carnithine racemase
MRDAPPDRQAVSVETVAPGVALLTLDRPDKRNALSRDTIAALHEHIDRLGRDASIAAIVLSANGPAFSSGHDLKELTARRGDADGGEAFFKATLSACADMMLAIVACPKPVIAAVEGIATAAGCQLVATCDLAVAGAEAGFATPGVDIGLFCSTPMVALSRNVARKHAMEMLLLGKKIEAEDALRFGLVNRVVTAGRARDEAVDLARTIASKSKATVAIGKQAFYRQADMALADAYAYASEVMVANTLADDACEGMSAFLEKRPPKWKDS